MYSRNLNKISVSMAMVVTLLAALHGPHAGASVLCVGADGHVEVEPAAGVICAGEEAEMLHHAAPAPAKASPVWTASGVDHCGECTDIPYMAHPDLDNFDPRLQTPAIYAPASRSTWQNFPENARLPHPVAESDVPSASATIGLKKSISLQR